MSRAWNRWQRRSVAVVAIALPLGLTALAGCSSGSAPSAAESATPAATVASSASPAPATVIKVAVTPGTAKGFVGARKDISGLSCKQSGNVWTAAGSVTNSGKATVNYRIYTAFLAANNDTRGLVQTDVTGVAPRATKKWSGQLTIKANGLHCVLRVERTDAR